MIVLTRNAANTDHTDSLVPKDIPHVHSKGRIHTKKVPHSVWAKDSSEDSQQPYANPASGAKKKTTPSRTRTSQNSAPKHEAVMNAFAQRRLEQWQGSSHWRGSHQRTHARNVSHKLSDEVPATDMPPSTPSNLPPAKQQVPLVQHRATLFKLPDEAWVLGDDWWAKLFSGSYSNTLEGALSTYHMTEGSVQKWAIERAEADFWIWYAQLGKKGLHGYGLKVRRPLICRASLSNDHCP